MDEIKDRLKQAVETCTKAYESWRAKTTDHTAREALQDAVHELRKVAARLEIELAVADRQQNPNDPIPIPAHRAAGRGRGAQQGPADDIGNSVGGGDEGSRPVRAPRPPRPRSEDGEGGSKPLSLKRSSEE